MSSDARVHVAAAAAWQWLDLQGSTRSAALLRIGLGAVALGQLGGEVQLFSESALPAGGPAGADLDVVLLRLRAAAGRRDSAAAHRRRRRGPLEYALAIGLWLPRARGGCSSRAR